MKLRVRWWVALILLLQAAFLGWLAVMLLAAGLGWLWVGVAVGLLCLTCGVALPPVLSLD